MFAHKSHIIFYKKEWSLSASPQIKSKDNIWLYRRSWHHDFWYINSDLPTSNLLLVIEQQYKYLLIVGDTKEAPSH